MQNWMVNSASNVKGIRNEKGNCRIVNHGILKNLKLKSLKYKANVIFSREGVFCTFF